LQKKLKVSAQSAAQSAKQHLDHVLLGFQHTAMQKLKATPIAPGDLIHRVGRGVLERATVIRASLIQAKLAPSWIKDRPDAVAVTRSKPAVKSAAKRASGARKARKITKASSAKTPGQKVASKAAAPKKRRLKSRLLN
jgi:hypothetical protein